MLITSSGFSTCARLLFTINSRGTPPIGSSQKIAPDGSSPDSIALTLSNEIGHETISIKVKPNKFSSQSDNLILSASFSDLNSFI